MTMHGDLVNGLCFTAFVPVYLWLWRLNPEEGAGVINFFFVATAIFSWISWYQRNVFASICAGVCMSASIAGTNLFEWPHKGEVVVIPQFLWSLVIISANRPLSFSVKTGLAFQALAVALFVVVQCPLIEAVDALPLLIGATAVHVLMHHFCGNASSGAKQALVNARVASVILAGTFAHHVTTELFKMKTIPGYGKEGGYSILKAGFFASLGLTAAATFQEQVDMKQALEELVAQRTKEIVTQTEKLRVVEFALQASETAIGITDSQRKIVWLNPALRKILNRNKSAGSVVRALAASATTQEQLKECFDPLGRRRMQLSIGKRLYTAEVSPFLALAEKPGIATKEIVNDHSFFLVLKDVTEQKACEEAESAIQKGVLLKQAMMDSMETLSHELRTPLQAIMGMASLVLDQDKIAVEEARESLSIIMASSRHLLTLINNLLDVRKCDASMLDEFQSAPMSLSSAMTDALDFCRPMASITDVDLRLDGDGHDSSVKIQSNPLRFQQVLINLVSNAIKYTTQGSTVHMSSTVTKYGEIRKLIESALSVGTPLSLCKSEGDASNGGLPPDEMRVAIISVRDEGPGVASNVADKIFAKFSQVTTHRSSVIGGNTVAQPSGTGLGLNLCVKFVERMKGNIWVSNNSANGGAVFSFFLPISTSDEISGLPIQQSLTTTSLLVNNEETKQATTCRPVDVSTLSILVVDDTVINLKVLNKLLRRIGITKLVAVDSGAKAISALEQDEFDLVITDIQMPEMSGTELCEAIRRKEGLVAKPVVVGLTAETGESLMDRCAAVGMSHVLHKPITKDQIQCFFDNEYAGLVR